MQVERGAGLAGGTALNSAKRRVEGQSSCRGERGRCTARWVAQHSATRRVEGGQDGKPHTQAWARRAVHTLGVGKAEGQMWCGVLCCIVVCASVLDPSETCSWHYGRQKTVAPGLGGGYVRRRCTAKRGGRAALGRLGKSPRRPKASQIAHRVSGAGGRSPPCRPSQPSGHWMGIKRRSKKVCRGVRSEL